MVDAHNADNKDKTNADFNLLYSRAIIVQQVWPWTCLVDMKTSKCFYRNELEDYFQFDPPSEFLLNEDGTIFVDSNNPNSSGTGTRDPEEEDEDMRAAVRATPEIFDLLKGVGEGNDGTVSVI